MMYQNKKFWLLGSVYLNAVAIGVICSWIFSSPDRGGENQLGDKESWFSFDELMNSDSGYDAMVERTVSIGDRQFQIGEFDRAILNYKGSAPNGKYSDATKYRIGLALEATARFQDAKAIYSALNETTRKPYFRQVSSLGLARLFQKTGKQEEGRKSLWRIFLDQPIVADDSSKVDENSAPEMELVGATSHLLAIACADDVIGGNFRISTDVDTPVHMLLPFDPQFFLADLIQREGERDPFGVEIPSQKDSPDSEKNIASLSDSVPETGRPGKLIIEPVREGLKLIDQIIKVHAKPVGLVELLLALEEKLGLEINFSATAGAAVEFRAQSVLVDQIQLATLLHGLFDPLNLYWKEEDNVISVYSETDLEPEVLWEFRNDRAIHMLRYSIFDFPDNHFLCATQFVHGNLSFQNRDWTTAIANYREALKNRILTSFLRRRASFNMGKAFLHLGDVDQAERALYFAVDDSFGGDLVATSLIIIARQRLLKTDYESAIKHASRAISAAMSREFKEEAILLLSSLYLMDEKYFAGNQVLMDHKLLIRGEEMTTLASFLSAYARYFAQPVHFHQEPEGLLRSLNMVELPNLQLPHLSLLVAKAQREFGFQQESIESMVSTFSTMMNSKLRMEFRRQIGRSLLEAGPYSQSMQLFEDILLADRNENETPVQLIRNASLEFDNGNFENCKRLCERVLELNIPPDFERQALVLMGRAFERTGDHHAAATFFAGIYEKKK